MKKALLLALSIVFCAAPLAAEELAGTLARIQKSGKIRIGYRQSEPPMSYLDENKKPAGYSIDICSCIAEAVEKKIGKDIRIDYVPVTAQNRFTALADNTIDILCGSTTKTLARSGLVDFTQLTFVTGASLMTYGPDSAPGSGFAGKKIGVVKGSTTLQALQELLRETGTQADIVAFSSADEGLNALRKKKIDAFSADQIVLIGMILNAPDRDAFIMNPSVFSFEPFALAVRRNDADFRLVADREIASLSRSNKLFDIYEKWIGKYTGQRPPLFEALVKLNATPE